MYVELFEHITYITMYTSPRHSKKDEHIQTIKLWYGKTLGKTANHIHA